MVVELLARPGSFNFIVNWNVWVKPLHSFGVWPMKEPSASLAAPKPYQALDRGEPTSPLSYTFANQLPWR